MEPGELSAAEFELFSALIYRISGIRIPDTKKIMLSNRLRRRLRATKIESYLGYFTLLSSLSGKGEIPFLIDAVTTNETFFFRDKHHFDWLGQTYFPGVLAEAKSFTKAKSLKVWSAAASTGEELYSILLEFLPFKERFSGWKLSFLGTDLSQAALEQARLGSYDERALRNVEPKLRDRYFKADASGKRWVVDEQARALAVWKTHNLLAPLAEDPQDLIMIKNVLIYFDAQSKKSASRRLIDALAPGGSLIVGPTEGIHGMLEPLEKKSHWLYQKPK